MKTEPLQVLLARVRSGAYATAIACLVLASPTYGADAVTITIKPFTTDGCSAWPDGTIQHRELWLRCCTVHDIAYWRGGTRSERRDADEALRDCVAEVGEPEIAAIMLAGVRVGGSPYWPTSFRWGYGWAWLRGYRAVSDDEQIVVDAALHAAGIDPNTFR